MYLHTSVYVGTMSLCLMLYTTAVAYLIWGIKYSLPYPFKACLPDQAHSWPICKRVCLAMASWETDPNIWRQRWWRKIRSWRWLESLWKTLRWKNGSLKSIMSFIKRHRVVNPRLIDDSIVVKLSVNLIKLVNVLVGNKRRYRKKMQYVSLKLWERGRKCPY